MKISSPAEGDIYRIDSSIPGESQAIELRAMCETPNIEWFVNGKYYGSGKRVFWTLQPGEFTIKAVADGKIEDSVSIIIVQ
ncbi:MAG: hypothetical protein A2Y33_13070 [Spirochaetes bacterium GWF1_51_8]|nr:MAG: hypothetical protein A2Y33_13070 [Spirochaetes bacterium GWF1_51_8]